MSKKIYVGNLSYKTSETEIKNLFSVYGEILSIKVIEDQSTGRSKGFGFVEMASDESVSAAIKALNGKEVDGREIKVNEAINKPKPNNYRNNY